eukprot:361262-Chlamydomonas_euryale.AAC.3
MVHERAPRIDRARPPKRGTCPRASPPPHLGGTQPAAGRRCQAAGEGPGTAASTSSCSAALAQRSAAWGGRRSRFLAGPSRTAHALRPAACSRAQLLLPWRWLLLHPEMIGRRGALLGFRRGTAAPPQHSCACTALYTCAQCARGWRPEALAGVSGLQAASWRAAPAQHSTADAAPGSPSSAARPCVRTCAGMAGGSGAATQLGGCQQRSAAPTDCCSKGDEPLLPI